MEVSQLFIDFRSMPDLAGEIPNTLGLEGFARSLHRRQERQRMSRYSQVGRRDHQQLRLKFTHT
jgi:hypothetical protein